MSRVTFLQQGQGEQEEMGSCVQWGSGNKSFTHRNRRRGSEPAVRCRKFDRFGSWEMRTFLVAAAVFVNGDRFISGSEGQKRSIGILKTEDVAQPLFESGGQYHWTFLLRECLRVIWDLCSRIQSAHLRLFICFQECSASWCKHGEAAELNKSWIGGFPGGPVAKNLGSQWRGCRLDPWSGN